jgi:hypothetical protein
VVTCDTCHRGISRPNVHAQPSTACMGLRLMDEPGDPNEQAAGQSTADQVSGHNTFAAAQALPQPPCPPSPSSHRRRAPTWGSLMPTRPPYGDVLRVRPGWSAGLVVHTPLGDSTTNDHLRMGVGSRAPPDRQTRWPLMQINRTGTRPAVRSGSHVRSFTAIVCASPLTKLRTGQIQLLEDVPRSPAGLQGQITANGAQ